MVTGMPKICPFLILTKYVIERGFAKPLAETISQMPAEILCIGGSCEMFDAKRGERGLKRKS